MCYICIFSLCSESMHSYWMFWMLWSCSDWMHRLWDGSFQRRMHCRLSGEKGTQQGERKWVWMYRPLYRRGLHRQENALLPLLLHKVNGNECYGGWVRFYLLVYLLTKIDECIKILAIDFNCVRVVSTCLQVVPDLKQYCLFCQSSRTNPAYIRPQHFFLLTHFHFLTRFVNRPAPVMSTLL